MNNENSDWEMTVTMDIVIPKLWFNFCQDGDLFRRDHCGYWLYGAYVDKNKTWLVYEQGDDGRPSREDEEKAIEMLVNAKYSDPLPEGFMLFGLDQMIEAYKHGIRLWGVNWEEEADALYFDKVIQLALLGEHRYG